MLDRLRTRLDAGRQDGFTLIELLIVIVILGVLAGIVVFAVGGISDRGDASACKSDVKAVEVAQEAHRAKVGTFGSMAQLTSGANQFLRNTPPASVTTTSSNKYAVTTSESTGAVTVQVRRAGALRTAVTGSGAAAECEQIS